MPLLSPLIFVSFSHKFGLLFLAHKLRFYRKLCDNDTNAFGPVAQWLEQGTHNPLVVGSSPTGPTMLRVVAIVEGETFTFGVPVLC